jgi:putative ABC transport system permease protein
MAPTGSPWDRAIVIPVEGVWEVHGLANGHAPEAGDRIGPPFDAAYFPGTPAILVRADAVWANYALKSRYTTADMMGIFPGSVLSQLHGLLADVRAAMSVLAVATQAMVAIGVLAGLVLLMRIFARSLALLRAIGAPVRFVLAVVWSYAAALIALGAAVGLVLGWGAAVVLSVVLSARTEMRIAATIGWTEVQMVAAFLSLALVLALIPARLSARRPIVSDLRT